MSCFYLLIFYLILNLNLAFAVCRYVKLINCPLPEYPTLTTYFKKKKNTFSLYTSNKTYHDRIVFNSNVNFFKTSYLYMHNSHFILFCIFSLSSVSNMSLSGSEDCANTS